MLSSSLLLAIILLFSSLSSTFAQTTVTVGDQYTAVQTTGVPTLLTQTVARPVFTATSYADQAARLDLPFPFYMYGEPYSTLYITNYGMIQFGNYSSEYGYGYGASIPIDQYDGYSVLPVFEPFYIPYADVTTAPSNVTWSLETVSAGQRAVVLRYANIQYSSDYTDATSFDVLLYESPVGQIDVRYYRVDVDTSTFASFSVGMQSSEGLLEAGGESSAGEYMSTYFLLYSTVSIDATAQSTMQNTVVRFNFTGLVDNNSTCGAGSGFDLRNISQSDLVYWDVARQAKYFLRVCGPVSQADCTATLGAQGFKASVCQTQVDVSGVVTGGGIYPLAVYNPNAIYWQSTTTGVSGTIADGLVCPYSANSGLPRITIFNYQCVPTATSAVVTGYAEGPTCVYTFNISTNIVCGNSSSGAGRAVKPSTLSSCQNITGVGYTATWCPRNLTSASNVYPPTLANLVIDPTLVADDGSDTITIGFNVNLYGTNYSVLAVDSNGLITFGPQTTTAFSPGPFPDLGLYDQSDYFPLIAPLWVDTYNQQGYDDATTYNGFIGYSLEGSAPNRMFYVRWNAVSYYPSHDFIIPGKCTYDVVFYENSTNIETRYYHISPNSGSFDTLAVGMHGQNLTAYTAVQNSPLLSLDVAARLSYSTITYRYNGPSEAAVCGAGLYPQLANIPDLSLTSGASRYWLKPCGVTTTSACSAAGLATQGASVCQSTGGAVASLATENPTATQWFIVSATSVRSITQDGAWSYTCGAPPTVIVDYVCNSSATAAVLSSVVNTDCTYSFVVSTVLLCAAAPPAISSSASARASSSSSSLSPSSSRFGSSSAVSSSFAVSSSAVGSSSAVSSSVRAPASSSSSSPAVSSTAAASSSSVYSSSSSSSALLPVSSSAAASVTSSSSSAVVTRSSTVAPSSTAATTSSSTAPQPQSSTASSSSSSFYVASSSSSSSALPAAPSSSSSSSGAAVGGGDTSSSGLSGGAIAGIVIGSVVGAALLCLIVACLLLRGARGGDKEAAGPASKKSDRSRLSQPSVDTTSDTEGVEEVELQQVEP